MESQLQMQTHLSREYLIRFNRIFVVEKIVDHRTDFEDVGIQSSKSRSHAIELMFIPIRENCAIGSCGRAILRRATEPGRKKRTLRKPILPANSPTKRKLKHSKAVRAKS